jgi:hypothetical protein
MSLRAADARAPGRDGEWGQATLEYVLIITVALGLTTFVTREFVGPVMARIRDQLSSQIRNGLFRDGGFHQLRIRRR